MTCQRLSVILIYILVIYQNFQTAVSNKNTVFDDLHFYTDDVSWVDAVNRCHDNTATLVSVDPEPGNSLNNITAIKRSVHFKSGNESWIGDYVTYDVISGNDISLNVHVHKCVAIQVISEKVLPDKLVMYEYNIITENCTTQLPAICSSNNNTFINAGQSTSSWSDAQRCKLWQPAYEILPIAKQTKFANGNFTSPQRNSKLFNQVYWVNYVVQEQFSRLPVKGNILQCGYIGFTNTNVSYTNCFEKKPFICRSDKEESVISPSSSNKNGLYIGVSVSVVLIVAANVGVTLFIVKIRRGQDIKPLNDLPHGGKSFTRRKMTDDAERKGEDIASANENNRITTYHQIDCEQMKTKPNDDEENFDPDNRVSDHTYSIVQKKKKGENKPDIIPRVTKTKSVDRPGYLSMDGTNCKQNIDEINQEYDFLESTQSTNSLRYGKLERNASNDNMYSSITSGAKESTYDVTFQRGSSQKRLINEDYDHVMIESESMTMSRGMCDSIGENYISTNNKSSPVINPVYDKVVMK